MDRRVERKSGLLSTAGRAAGGGPVVDGDTLGIVPPNRLPEVPSVARVGGFVGVDADFVSKVAVPSLTLDVVGVWSACAGGELSSES